MAMLGRSAGPWGWMPRGWPARPGSSWAMALKASKERVDILVVERGLAPTRAKAQAMVLAGQVVVNDQRVDKPGTLVPSDAELRLKGEVMPYVSRGGLKLKGALSAFKL